MNKLIRILLVAFFVAAVSMTIADAAGRRIASVPYVGRFRAAGLTEDVIAARIRKALTSAGILK